MRNYKDTIFALATKKNKSAIAVFRISGKNCLKITKNTSIKKKLKTKTPVVCYLTDKDKEKIDQVILTFFKSPKSYTGEDMIEISSHGSISVINKITETLLEKSSYHTTI